MNLRLTTIFQHICENCSTGIPVRRESIFIISIKIVP